MTTDEQEAESRKYGAVAMVLRLESHSYAVYGPNRKLYLIVEVEELEGIFKSDAFWTWCREQTKEQHSFRPGRSPAINLEDIGEIEI